jgi:hypothetical protein
MVELSVKNVPIEKRCNLRALACATNIPRSTLAVYLKKSNMLKRVTSTLRPFLTEENMTNRLKYALSFVKSKRDGALQFDPMYDRIHVDEKWFYMTKVKQTYYIWHDETAPLRSTKSKRFITKVLFLCAVARPRYDHHRKQMFDGKLGLWPVVTREPAKRTSVNRARGTLVTKPINVTADVYRDLLVNCVVPAIKEKFPVSMKNVPLYIQQDNAGPHISTEEFQNLCVGGDQSWDIRLTNQPPNSPDFNVLDLGFFNTIQSLQYQSSPKTIDELIVAVENAFNLLPCESLAKVFVTLQKVMELAIGLKGSNAYKLPHMHKDKEHLDCTVYNVICDPDSFSMALLSLNSRLVEEEELSQLAEDFQLL